MTMSKHDYVRVAHIVNDELDAVVESHLEPGAKAAVYEAMRRATIRLSNVFQEDNPRFDRAKFLDACGVESYR